MSDAGLCDAESADSTSRAEGWLPRSSITCSCKRTPGGSSSQVADGFGGGWHQRRSRRAPSLGLAYAQELSDADCSDGVRLAVRGVEGGRMAPNTASSPSNIPPGFPSPVLLSPAPIAPPSVCTPGSVAQCGPCQPIPVPAKVDAFFLLGHEGARCSGTGSGEVE